MEEPMQPEPSTPSDVEADALDAQAAPPEQSSPLLGAAGDRILDFLRDVPLDISVELGRTSMSIGDFVSLGPSSVIELSKSTDDPLDIRVNGVLIAHGEAVVSNERFGVRLTSVVEPRQLLESVKKG